MNTFEKNFANIIEAVNHCKGHVVNDHGNRVGLLKVTGIGNLQKGEKKIPVIFCDSRYFSLNRLYLDENNVPHVSRESVGGVVELHGAPLEQGILAYNEAQIENIMCYSFLTDIHYVVDGKLEASDLVPAEKVAEMQATAKAGYDKWNAEYEARKQA